MHMKLAQSSTNFVFKRSTYRKNNNNS